MCERKVNQIVLKVLLYKEGTFQYSSLMAEFGKCFVHVSLIFNLVLRLFDILQVIQLVFLGLLILASIRPDVLKPDDNQQPFDGIVVVQTDQGDIFEDFAAAESAKHQKFTTTRGKILYFRF